MKYLINNETVVTLYKTRTSTCLHVYKNHNLIAVIHFEEKIQEYCITYTGNPDEWTLFCVSASQRLYEINGKEINEAKYSRHKSNQEIFTDLLDGDGDDQDGLNRYEASEPILYINLVSAIFTLPYKATSIASHREILAITTLRESKCVVDLYQAGKNRTILHLSSFYISQTHDEDAQSSLVYFCTCPLIEESEPLQSPSSLIYLPSELFVGIFGKELVLIKSRIIVLCPPGGCVYYAPVKTVEDDNTHYEWTEFRLLCYTSLQVISIQSCKLTRKEEKEDCIKNDFESDRKLEDFVTEDVLLVCTKDGRCLVGMLSKDVSARFVPFTVPGWVTCIAVCGSCLFVSTETDIHQLQLEIESQKDQLNILISKKISLNLSNVTAFLCLPDLSLVADLKCRLLCQLRKGNIIIVDPDERSQTDIPASRGNAGQNIKDLLSSIDDCQKERDGVIKLQQVQRHFIHQLHLAAHLLSSGVKVTELFKINLSSTIPKSGLLSDVCICCQVTNESQIILSTDWTVMITIHQTDCIKKSVTKTIHLVNELKPRGMVSILIPLPSKDIHIPYQLEIFFILNLPLVLQLKEFNCTPALSVLSDTRHIDIMHFLYQEHFFNRTVHKSDTSSSEMIQQLAEQRPISYNLLRKDVHEADVKEESCSIQISFTVNGHFLGNGESELLGHILGDIDGLPAPPSNPTHLLSLSGHKVMIGLQKVKGQEDKSVWIITVQCDTISLAAAVRQCVLLRVKGLSKDCSMKISNSKAITGHLKLLRDMLHTANNITIDASINSTQQILSLYKQLRQIPTIENIVQNK